MKKFHMEQSTFALCALGAGPFSSPRVARVLLSYLMEYAKNAKKKSLQNFAVLAESTPLRHRNTTKGKTNERKKSGSDRREPPREVALSGQVRQHLRHRGLRVGAVRGPRRRNSSMAAQRRTAAMSRQDYKLVASVAASKLRGYRLVMADGPTESRHTARLYRNCLAIFLRELAVKMEAQNKAFKAPLFFTDCGLTSDGELID